MMILWSLFVFVSLSSGAPLNPKVDKEAIEEDARVEIVKGEDILDDGFHSHNSQDKDRDARFVFNGGDVSIGEMSFSGDHANIKVASFIIEDMPQDPNPTVQVVNGEYLSWSDYSPCSRTCGDGLKTRTRTCTDAQHGDKTCEEQGLGPHTETVVCNDGDCPPAGLKLEVCSAGEITSGSCLCKSADDEESEEECSVDQGCTDEGACYAVCPSGPYILQEDCFCKETNGGGNLCQEGYRCEGGECVETINDKICDFDDSLLAPREMGEGDLSPYDTNIIFKWDNNVVPYYYKDETPTEGDKDLIQKAMNRIQEETCFTFEEETEDDCEDEHCLEIHITDAKCTGGCAGSVAKDIYGDILKLSLSAHITHDNGDDCGYQGLVIHELMHALGVAHTQRRKDRDDFISVRFENLRGGGNIEEQYRKCDKCQLFPSIPYDCRSIMHYGTYSFSKNSKEVIKAKDEKSCQLKKRANMFYWPPDATTDYELLNLIGNCPGTEPEISTAASTTAVSTAASTTMASTTGGTTATSTTVELTSSSIMVASTTWATTVASITAASTTGASTTSSTTAATTITSTTAASTTTSKMAAPPGEIFKWENNVVPYYYNGAATIGDKVLVRTAMNRIQEETCFKFEEKTKDEYENEHSLEIYIRDVKCTDGVSGLITSVANRVQLSLSGHITHDNGDDCGYQGVVIHNLMLVLGAIRTHQRSDRDDFITVKFENLRSGGNIEEQYKKCDKCQLFPSIPYDCRSIMHYGTHSFSRNRKEVIKAKDEETCPIRKRANMFYSPDATVKDYKLLNLIGNCPACNGPPASTSHGSWTCESELTSCELICTLGYTPVIHNTECVNGQWDTTINHVCALNTNKLYLLAGGYNAQSNIELYHPTLGSPLSSCKSPPPQLDTTEKHKYWRRHTSFYHDNTIYLCGGDDQLSTCLSLNPSSSSSWTAHTLPSPVGRGLSSLVFNDKVVFVGGKDFSGNEILATSMTLPLSSSPTLTLVPNLSYLGSSQCVAKLDATSLIISGGYSNNSPLSTVLLYNLETESVSTLAPLSPPRDGLSCITVEQEEKMWLIVTGGWDDKEKAMATTQRLDIEANTWEDLGDLKEARSGHTMINSESRGIMVLAGLDGDNKEMDSVELLMNKEWKKIKPSLETARDSFGGAVEISADLFSCQLDLKPGSVYLLAGGWGATRDITLYDPTVSNLVCSTPPPPLNKEWRSHRTFYHDNTIYLCGGWDTASTCISHTPGNPWKTHKLTTSRRQGHSTVVLQDRVYFIGGVDSSNNYIGAESTALPLTDTPVLTPVPNLDYKGMYQCTARIDQDTLVITGGFNYNNGVLSTVSTYNTRTGAFTQLPQLKQARAYHGCGVWEEGNNKWIIVAGGDNDDEELQTTKMLELGGSDSEWISMENLNVARAGHSMAVTQRGVMVMGGLDASGYDLSSVELLDWNTKSWSLVEPSLNKPRSDFGGAVELPAPMFGCTGKVCSAGEINPASCFCKSVTDDESGEVCYTNQGCAEGGTCYDLCTPGPYRLQSNCFCQEKTTKRGKLCTEGSKCEDGGCLFKEAQESCSFNDNLLIPSPMIDGKISPYDTSALFKWENNLVPYYYSARDTYVDSDGNTNWASDGDKDLVRSVMDRIEEKTCFKFEEKNIEEYEDKRVLEIVINDALCGSVIGAVKKVPYKPKRTQLYLSAHITDSDGDDCGYKGLLTHELMHALGVGHTQTRTDRDNFITVRFENIDKNMESQFQKCENCKLYDEIPYDCGSIMHYGTHMYDKEVIVPKENCQLDYFPLSDYVTDAPEKDYDLLKIIGQCAGPSVYLIAGGYGAKRDIALYDPTVSNLVCSTPPPPLDTDWSHHSTFYHDNTIYLCGGQDTASICISHTPGNGWKTHTLTTEREWGLSTVVLQDRVYFIGGEDSSGNYIGAESTALPLTDTPVLTPVPNLDYKGLYQCTARIDQDTLVITGGEHKGVYVSIVSTYNWKTGAITQLPQLKQARNYHGCGVWEEGNNKWIIVAGGYNSNYGGVLQTTEMLELGGSDSEWISMGNLNVARYGHSMAVTQRGVMVIGGSDASYNDLSSVELFDWNTKTWSLVEPSLDKPRSFFGGAVELPASMFGCTG